MHTPHIRRLLTCAVGVLASATALCGTWYKGPGEGQVGYWDDLSRWYTWYYFTEKATDIYHSSDVNFIQSGTVLVTNNIAAKCNYWSILVANAKPNTVIRIMPGGSLRVSNGFVVGGSHGNAQPNPGYGVLDIRPGGTNECTLTVGSTGHGVVTNAGVLGFGNMVIGRDAASTGVYVHDGGFNNLPYPKDITIGKDGDGELLVRGGKFNWYWYRAGSQMIGFVSVGCGAGAGHGRLAVEDGATCESGPLAVGGKDDTAGRGEIVLRGGTIVCDNTIGTSGLENLWIGAGTNAAGAVRGDSYGEVRGWGKFQGNTSSEADTQPRSICARLGNGAIIADGEGVERTLDCSTWWQVTNVLFGVETTNGWFAVNKGAVTLLIVDVALDATDGDNWGCSVGTNAVGCSRGLKKPDLLNAVRIRATRGGWAQQGWFFGAMVLAADRADAHADALGEGRLPLGFWKLGTFGERKLTKPRSYSNAHAKFRYDARKISRPDSRVSVFRWDAEGARWKRLNRHSQPPADGIAESGEFSGSSGDPDWTLGTFCVAEELPRGMTLFVR